MADKINIPDYEDTSKLEYDPKEDKTLPDQRITQKDIAPAAIKERHIADASIGNAHIASDAGIVFSKLDSATVAGVSATQTLTGKTLTSPIINTPTITLANNAPLLAKDSAGTAQDLITVDASNRVVVGDTALAGVYGVTGCFLYNSSAQTISNNSEAIITFASELYDPLGMHSTSVNTGRITVPVAGVYWVSAFVMWDDDTTNDARISRLYVDGVELISSRATVDAAGRASNSVAVPISASASSYIELRVFHLAGNNLNANRSSLSAWLVGV